MKSKSFFISAVCICLSAMILLAVPTAYIDPFFHYHAPIEGVSYRLYDERSQNDGILRSFEYDSIMIGTSITQNFKKSEFDALFGANSVKVPFDGLYFKEMHDRLTTAYESGNEIKRILVSLDLMSLLADKDAYGDFDYPEYLYDKDPFNDVAYLFNTEVLFDYTIRNIKNTNASIPSTSFDDYSARANPESFDREKVLASYKRPDAAEERPLSEERLADIRASLEQNVLSLVRGHRETEFVFFIPPCSILKIDSWIRTGNFSAYMEIFREASRMLLAEENVSVFCFYEESDIVCDLDLYRDTTHYNAEVCSFILGAIADQRHALDKDTLDAYFEQIVDHYENYDYEALFAK